MGRSKKAPDGDGQFVNASYFNFNDERLNFNSNDVRNQNPNFGSLGLRLPGM